MSRKRRLNKSSSNPDALKHDAIKALEERQGELADIKAVMSTIEGRRLLFRIINKLCHYDENSAMSSGSDTYFREGEREIGCILKGDVYEGAFNEYQQSEREWKEELDKNKRRLGVDDLTSTLTEPLEED
jgi:hypothetical protein